MPAAAPQRAAGMSTRTHAAIYNVLGVLIVVIGLPLIFALHLGGALIGPAVILVVGAMYAMFTRARRVLQQSAEAAQQGDPRPPILFLRSFRDDKYKLKERVRVAGVPINQPLRMEEALAVRFRDFGPFLAVGEPGEGLPQLGAARAYLSDDQWQAAVLNWIRESRLIAMLCGPTQWIHWEMQNIIRSQRLDRVLLLLPPGRKPGSATGASGRSDGTISFARSNKPPTHRHCGGFRSTTSCWSSSGRMAACACFAAPATWFRITNLP